MMLKKTAFHPFAFALYFVLALLANNIDRVQFQDAYRTAVLVLLATGAVFGLFWLLTRSVQRAGLICATFVLLFSTLGHSYTLLEGKRVLGVPIGQGNVLVALYTGSFVFLTWFFWRALKQTEALTYLLNLIALILISFPLLQIALFPVRNALAGPRPVQGGEVGGSRGEQPPDIYYIILDEYARADVLAEILDYDNSVFIQALEERGFYVADESRANYIITHLSLSSSLNLTYLDGLVAPDETEQKPTVAMIRDSLVRSFLTQQGYRYVSFATGFQLSDTIDSDIFIRPESYTNDFEMNYLYGTALRLVEAEIVAPRQRALIHNAFDGLASIPEMESDQPNFVFAHTPGVHVPYVFGPNGEEVSPWFFDSYTDIAAGRTYAAAYRDQLAYINTRLLETIDAILNKSARKPIIILQGDHGSQAFLDWYSMENTCYKERASILNAYYFPDQNYELLYPSISPVNTFRVIFNQYFGTQYERLDDRSYYSYWDYPYQFHDVTGQNGNCPPAGG